MQSNTNSQDYGKKLNPYRKSFGEFFNKVYLRSEKDFHQGSIPREKRVYKKTLEKKFLEDTGIIAAKSQIISWLIDRYMNTELPNEKERYLIDMDLRDLRSKGIEINFDVTDYDLEEELIKYNNKYSREKSRERYLRKAAAKKARERMKGILIREYRDREVNEKLRLYKKPFNAEQAIREMHNDPSIVDSEIQVREIGESVAVVHDDINQSDSINVGLNADDPNYNPFGDV